MWVTLAGGRSGRSRRSIRSTTMLIVPSRRLEAAGGEHQRLRAHRQAEAVVHRRRDDQVDRAVLVLEQHERHALGGRGPLAGDHEAGHAHAAAVRVASRAPCSCCRSCGQAGAHQLERVLAQRHAGRAVVGQHPLPGAQRAQLGALVRVERQRQLGARPRPGCRARRPRASTARAGGARRARRRRARRTRPPRPAGRASPRRRPTARRGRRASASRARRSRACRGRGHAVALRDHRADLRLLHAGHVAQAHPDRAVLSTRHSRGAAARRTAAAPPPRAAAPRAPARPAGRSPSAARSGARTGTPGGSARAARWTGRPSSPNAAECAFGKPKPEKPTICVQTRSATSRAAPRSIAPSMNFSSYARIAASERAPAHRPPQPLGLAGA